MRWYKTIKYFIWTISNIY